MADKQVTLNFHLSDGSTEPVSFTVPEGGSGGINVIEYDPALNKILNPLDFTDFIENETATINTTSGEIAIATPYSALYRNNAYDEVNGNDGYTSHVSIELPSSGEFTIDASQCNDLWGFCVFDKDGYFTFLEDFITKTFYTELYDTTFPYACISSFNTSYSDPLAPHAIRERFKEMEKNLSENSTSQYSETLHKGVYTFKLGTYLDAVMLDNNMTEQQVRDMVGEDFEALGLSNRAIYNVNDPRQAVILDSTLDTVHFFISSYIDPSQTGLNVILDPSSKLTISFNEFGEVNNTIPNSASDGDYLHLQDHAKIFGKSLTKGTFVQLYDNTSKMIVHANQP